MSRAATHFARAERAPEVNAAGLIRSSPDAALGDVFGRSATEATENSALTLGVGGMSRAAIHFARAERAPEMCAAGLIRSSPDAALGDDFGRSATEATENSGFDNWGRPRWTLCPTVIG